MMQTVKRLYILDFGLFEVHNNQRKIGIPGYLIQTHVEKATLEDGLESFGRILTLTADNMPESQLAKIRLQPSDIDTLIMTHTDIDHVGNIADFPQATIVIHTDERAFEQPRYWNNRSPIAWPNNAYQLIDRDCDFCPGVQLLTTPGHAPGHLSMLLQLPETGAVLLIGDAISRPTELEEGFAGAWDEELAQASADKLMAIAKEENAFIIYGHDPKQWLTLNKAPAYYT